MPADDAVQICTYDVSVADRSAHPAQRAAYADAVTRPFWLDTLPQRDMHPPLSETTEADLCIVGGGYTGLWAALYAKELRPGARRRRARGDSLR